MSGCVILVDREDSELGIVDKLTAHTEARLHRAFSVFVQNSEGEILLQRRATSKYHSGGLWSNTCCSHPQPGESTIAAAHRRLEAEMGFDCPLAPVFSFVYHAYVGGGLFEHEYDHVFVGRRDAPPTPDPREVESWRWASPAQIRQELSQWPGSYTSWFRIAFHEMLGRGLL